MNILLGVTGSVAATLTPKMVQALQELGDVRVAVTKAAEYFLPLEFHRNSTVMGAEVYREESEWYQTSRSGAVSGIKVWEKVGDPVIHIGLRKWADVLVIAPLTDNTIAKMSYGICDNLLTCVYRAWDRVRPVVVAPAMNTMMWEDPLTQENIHRLQRRGIVVVPPATKMLACGDEGAGAMAHIDQVVTAMKTAMRWSWPLPGANDQEWRFVRPCRAVIPTGDHPGAFGTPRKHEVHTGVDLYTTKGTPVFAVEAGRIVGWQPFTGPAAGSPWWLNTNALLIEGASGVICYGGIVVSPDILSGELTRVDHGSFIGHVVPVLKPGKEHPGHSRAMLHLEVYTRDRRTCMEPWRLGEQKPGFLVDPTPFLLAAYAES